MNATDCRLRRAFASSTSPILNQHEYDHISGWCQWGCGCRSDGRVTRTSTGDIIYPGRGLTDEERPKFEAWARAENDKKRKEALKYHRREDIAA